jgi:hypothetical protein
MNAARRVSVLLVSAHCCVVTGPAFGQQTAPAAAAPIPTWRASAVNVTRFESWRFFEPRAGGGDPDYSFLSDRLRIEGRGHWRRVDVTLAAQYVGQAGLPTLASGPGALGTGSLYFDQGGRHEHPQQLYLRYANARFPNLLRGVDLQVGRMGYTSGAEAPVAAPKIETLKRQRLDSRLVGEFEWSIYQRGFDGVRLDLTRSRWQATTVAFMPTQGGFARAANKTITDIQLFGATVSSRPSAPAESLTQVQAFTWHYRDRRAVAQRPDNSATAAASVDVDVTTVGGVLLGAYRRGAGEIDVFGWVAPQLGSWYENRHQAAAGAIEAGYQWTKARWRPWVRLGLLHTSGDDDGADDRHGTFFPVLPTVRRYSQTTTYSTMNLNDRFLQLLARPRPSLGVRIDVHDLTLASAADLWYAGSGATLGDGNVFGYAGRRSNGSRRLGRSLEASVDLTLNSRFSVAAFVSRIDGGRVVAGTFAEAHLWYGYLESVLTLSSR